MRLIDEIFKRYIVITDRLVPYGFEKKNEGYVYSQNIHNGSFELVIYIQDGKTNGKLIDKDFGDEFTQINVENASGSFLNEIREECTSILTDIRKKCFEKKDYIFPQTNRISKKIFEKYKVLPEFLFDKSEGCGVYRNKQSQKWFGLIMNIDKSKLIKSEKGEIEVINLNLHEKSSEYRQIEGVFEAFHMNKKYWVSVILDDSIDDNMVFEMIEISYANSNKK